MSRLRCAAEDYLTMRRTLGFKLTTQAAQLMSFVGHCESAGSDHITSELALEWATTTRSGSRHDAYLARRLMTVRIFARHYQTLDPVSEIPPEDALPQHKCRIAPYLYSPADVTALIDAAAGLRPPLRAATWRTLIGLLAVTGMRKREACNLDDEHIDLDHATLLILDSKFGKSRRLFLHDSTAFTVATMIGFYRDGGDVQARLPILSTWLGHVDPKSTYWYQQQVPELLALAVERLETVGGQR